MKPRYMLGWALNVIWMAAVSAYFAKSIPAAILTFAILLGITIGFYLWLVRRREKE